MSVEKESKRRRTFAIISHPDAGKTTITEKLLLYSGAIHLAGSVQGRKSARATVSDWMKMEKERGISISSSVLQFDHRGSALNLLDTPGHADFSEDTYRTLAAVDSALMLMDHSKGVEARTLKLFEVCRMRKLPVITFMNKLDRNGLDPLELLDDVATTLNLKVVPLNWPIGMGHEFRGVIDVRTKEVTLFESSEKKGASVLDKTIVSLEEAESHLQKDVYEKLLEDLELLEMAGDEFTLEEFYAGEVSPVFWGSAMTNFGIEPVLEFLADHAAPPQPRKTLDEVSIVPEDDLFTGFIFKIQANMNPRHRDRIAFLRVVSGRFERGIDVFIGRNKEKLRLAKPHSFMAQERSIVEQAFPGDIVGLYDPGKLRIGDTVCNGKAIKYAGIPRFAPEHFVRVILRDTTRRKSLDKGLDQLSHEGVIQLFFRSGAGRNDPYLGAVGILQFEVLKDRLKNEYNVTCEFESQPITVARWVRGPEEAIAWLQARRDYNLVEDRNGNFVILADSIWPLEYAQQQTKGLEFYDVEPL